MKRFHHHRDWAALCGLVLLLAGCDGRPEADDHAHHGAMMQNPADFERGPHNGRLLRDGDFALEVTIFETNVPPEFRIYPYQNDQPIAPNNVELVVELGRLGDRVDVFEFSAEGDYLRGAGAVVEPHSFEVAVIANHAGDPSRWRYESYEGRTQIEADVAQAMGIEVAQATAAKIREVIKLQGTVFHHPDAVTEVRGRFPGLVLSLHKVVGENVDEGEALALLQSNESMQTYVVTAPRAGKVVERSASMGSESSVDALYVIADMSNLIADFVVYSRDLHRIARGQTIAVSSLDGKTTYTGTIERILPVTDANNRTTTVHVALGDHASEWRPGQFVQGAVIVAEHHAAIAVRERALQSFRDFTVVYAREGDTYEVRMLELGSSDGEFVEVLGGLEAGTTYVSKNSYLVKADIEKSGASHDH